MIRIILLFFLIPSFLKAQIIITEVHYDTPFIEVSPRDSPRDMRRHLGEYIELYNFSSEDIRLKGWFITDYVSKYTFPDDAVIPSEGFIIVAYNNTDWYRAGSGFNSQNYFTTFFPNATGKESQIYYQESLILRNAGENLKLFMGELKGVETNYPKIYDMSWVVSSYNDFTFSPEATSNPANYNFYSSYSIHLDENGGYGQASPTPFSAEYLPLTQNMEDIQEVIDALNDVYSSLTWEDYANEILFSTCTLVINVVQQTPQETYTEIRKCFEYDNSGNKIASFDCSEEDDTEEEEEEETAGYSSAELDEINSKIHLYPNPTNSLINIYWDNSINGVISTIYISNQNGTYIGGQNIGSSQSSTQIDITMQPTGIYIVSFVLDSGQIISRNVIKI